MLPYVTTAHDIKESLLKLLSLKPTQFFKLNFYLNVYKHRYELRLVNIVWRAISIYYDNRRKHVIHRVNKTQS
jgi:uncharacterized ubiquitin-like protein YukD